MEAQGILDAFGLGELVARDILALQIVILTVIAALFALSISMAIFASRSAVRAGKARAEAQSLLKSAQDVVVEARQISAQIERAAASLKSAGIEPATPVRVGARETTPEADVSILNLDAAKESASVPKGLLGRLRR